MPLLPLLLLMSWQRSPARKVRNGSFIKAAATRYLANMPNQTAESAPAFFKLRSRIPLTQCSGTGAPISARGLEFWKGSVRMPRAIRGAPGDAFPKPPILPTQNCNWKWSRDSMAEGIGHGSEQDQAPGREHF